eukprot:SAG31_NODE_281_length_18584_cov_10.762564_9_plen_55_part_00
MHELSKRSARAKAAENIDIAKHLGIQQLFNHEQEHNQVRVVSNIPYFMQLNSYM